MKTKGASVFFLFLSLLLLGTVSRLNAQTMVCGIYFPPPPPNPDRRPPCDCKPYCQTSPCYAASGDYAFSTIDLSIPTRGYPVSISRTYDSARAVDGILGVGWTSNLTLRLTYVTYLLALPVGAGPTLYLKKAIVVMGDDRYEFTENPDGLTFTPPPQSHDTLVKNIDGTFDLTPKLTRSNYHFAADGALQSMTDDYGNSIHFLYDAGGQLYRVEDNGGSSRYLDLYYNANGRINYILDSQNRKVNFGYDAVEGTLTAVRDPEMRATHYSYVTGRFGPLLSQIRDEWGRVVSDITYDTAPGSQTIDRVLSYTEAGETYSYQYFFRNDPGDLAEPLKTVKTDSFGNRQVFTYDSQGQVTHTDLPGGAARDTVFNEDGSVQQTTDEEGIVTDYTYNANGSVAGVTRGSGAVRFNYAYEDAAFPEKVTSITPVFATGLNAGQVDPDWQAWRYDYYPVASPAPGALRHVYRVQSDGVTLDTLPSYTYNASGQAICVADATGSCGATPAEDTGGVTRYSYDATTGDLVSVTYPKNSDSGANPVYEYGRDALGRVTSVTDPLHDPLGDPLNHVTTYTYDNIDRIKTVTLPKPSPTSTLDFTTTYDYDIPDGPLVFTRQTDPNGKITKQGYDQYGQLVKSIDAANNATIFAYDRGLLSSITDANGNITGYSYDARRRLSATTFPDSFTESYTYRNDGILLTKTDRKNQTITYTYDNLNRLVRKSYPNSSSVSYNYTGQKLTSVVDTYAGETHTFDYDASYRNRSNTQGTRGTVDYTYDVADRVATMNGGRSTAYEYYDDGSLKTIDWGFQFFSYAYSQNGQMSTIDFPTGQQRAYTYDEQGRLTQLANTHPTAGNLATYAYGYDTDNATGQPTMLGQRTLMSADVPQQGFSGSQTKYYYDSNYQLTRSDFPSAAPFNGETDSWSYDAIGNRLTSTVSTGTATYSYYKNGFNPDNGQRLLSDGTYTYTYDENGNTLTRTGPEGVVSFTWDYENRLTAFSGPETYTYDYLGRRTSRTAGGGMSTFLYDGQNLVAKRGSLFDDFVYGPGIDEPLARVHRTERRLQNPPRTIFEYSFLYYVVDGLGSISLLNDDSGQVANAYVYDTWGIIRDDTPGPLGGSRDDFTYTARESTDAGLMYYRARYYNPNIGRFISEDPIGTSSTNLYPYVLDNPLRFKDPSGLEPQEECPHGCTCGKWYWYDKVKLDRGFQRNWERIQVINLAGRGASPLNQCLCHWQLVGIVDLVQFLTKWSRGVKCDCEITLEHATTYSDIVKIPRPGPYIPPPRTVTATTTGVMMYEGPGSYCTCKDPDGH